MSGSWWTRLMFLLLPWPVAAQSLAPRVRDAGDGTVRLSFAAREGVCGHGPGSIMIMSADADAEWESECDRGPVRVSMQLQGDRVKSADTYVGGQWRAGKSRVTDLGLVPAKEAAELLLELAREAPQQASEELLTAATLADSVVIWPQLLRMARDPALPTETRRQAVFWLGQAAGEAATKGLDSIAEDRRGELEIRKHAVFALSQRPADEGVPVLIRIARTSPQPEMRQQALFWLGQSEDPRALALFEELLQ